MTMMDCKIEEREGVAIIVPNGDLDIEHAESFQKHLDNLLGAGTRYFVIDLGEVAFVDSTGLSTLVRLYKRVRIGEGDVRLARVSPEVQKLFDLTRLSRVFDIYPTAAAAAESIKRD
jgi:anti-anti-sigma factor